MTTIPILYEDGEALVIDKPGGLPIETPRRGGPALTDLYDELKLRFHRPPVAVHRIDTDTSGCLLLARNPKALKRFSRAFEDRQVTKRYLGILAGGIADREGVIDLPLAKISSAEAGWRMVPDPDGKPSVTHWRRLMVVDGLTLVEFRPETGRTHQIRVHAASGLGVPLLGDPVYSPKEQVSTARRTMLHAANIAIPRDGKPTIEASAPLPPEFTVLGFRDE
ncbi:MAG: RNA pseudouridine synthase [Pontixanthobacter sp.]